MFKIIINELDKRQDVVKDKQFGNAQCLVKMYLYHSSIKATISRTLKCKNGYLYTYSINPQFYESYGDTCRIENRLQFHIKWNYILGRVIPK